MINNKIVLGYIGNGKSTNRYHLPFVMQRPDKFIVKTIYNPRIHHDIWDEIEGVNYTENQDDIFLDDEIDMVVVCTGHHYHYEYTKKALEHNKHCLVNKLKKSLHLQNQKDFIVQLIKIEDMTVTF